MEPPPPPKREESVALPSVERASVERASSITSNGTVVEGSEAWPASVPPDTPSPSPR